MVTLRYGKRKVNGGALVAMLPCIVIAALTVYNITGALRTGALLVCLLPYIFLHEKNQLLILFFYTGFAADINTSFLGIPYTTVLQTVFVLKNFINKSTVYYGYILFFLIISVTQMYAVIFCDLNFIYLLTFILNCLMMLTIGTRMEIQKKDFHNISFIYAISITVILVASMMRDPLFDITSTTRFEGIWTDPNFLGMFCALAAVLLYYWSEKKAKKTIFAIPLAVFILFFGIKTYSFTFIIAFCAMVGIFILDMQYTRIHPLFRFFCYVIFVIAIIFLLPQIFSEIVGNRRVSHFSGDWSHGRLDNIAQVLNGFSRNIGHALFGIGVNNSNNYTGFVAHNTFVELLAQFGCIGCLTIVSCIVHFLIKNQVSVRKVMTRESGYVFIILLYMMPLSMESTDIVYLLLGVAINRILADEKSIIVNKKPSRKLVPKRDTKKFFVRNQMENL